MRDGNEMARRQSPMDLVVVVGKEAGERHVLRSGQSGQFASGRFGARLQTRVTTSVRRSRTRSRSRTRINTSDSTRTHVSTRAHGDENERKEAAHRRRD